MPDFSQYQAPGVYVEDNSAPIVTTTGVPPTVVCLVGPAQGFQAQTDSLALYSGQVTSLSKAGIFQPGNTAPAGAPAFTVTLEDGTALTQGTDYVLAKVGTGRGALTTIKRQAGDPAATPAVAASTLVAEGQSVIVSYAYADADYFAPRDFDNFDSVMAAYGLPLTQTPVTNAAQSQVNSPLSLGVRVAFENGANLVVLVAVDPSSASSYREAFKQAYAKTIADERINVIVPLLAEPVAGDTHTYAVVQGFADDLAGHCQDAVDEGFGRVGILGVDRQFGAVGSGFAELANYLKNRRVALTYPNALSMFNGSTNQTTTVDGYYLAAAIGGILSANPVARSLTQQTVRSFSRIPAALQATMTTSAKNTLSRAGVMVVEADRSNTLSVRHGVTTDMSSLITKELSIVRTRDILLELVKGGLKAAALIGQPIGADTPIQVKGVLIGILESALSSGLILSYANVAVRQQALPTGDPSVIEVKFAYAPFVPLNYIVAQFSIDLNTGTTNLGLAA